MRRRRWLLWLAGLGAMLFFCCLCGFYAPLEALFQLLFGWVRFVQHNAGRVTWNGEAILGFVVALGALIGLAQLLATAWTRACGRAPWPVRRTLTLCGLFLGMFVTSIASAGLIHQTAWLFKDDEPIVQDSWRTGNALRLWSGDFFCQTLSPYADAETLRTAIYTDLKIRPYTDRHTLLVTEDPDHGLQVTALPGPDAPDKARVLTCTHEEGQWRAEDSDRQTAQMAAELDQEAGAEAHHILPAPVGRAILARPLVDLNAPAASAPRPR